MTPVEFEGVPAYKRAEITAQELNATITKVAMSKDVAYTSSLRPHTLVA